MNFVDAAVALLREARVPLHVEELCRRALAQGLLDSPGQTPLRSLKGRLTTELKRGPESRVVRVQDDVWDLTDAGSNGARAVAGAAEEAPDAGAGPGDAAHHVSGHAGAGADDALATQKEAVGTADDLVAPVGDLDERPAAHLDSTAARTDPDGELGDDEDDEDDDELDELDEDDELGDDEGDDDDDEADDEDDRAAQPDERQSDRADVDAGSERVVSKGVAGDVADDDDDEGDDAEDRAAEAIDEAVREAERAAMTPEERELLQAYGDDAGTAQVSALVEYRDHQSADEDRRMVPETLPERRSRGGREDWKTRRDRMRDKRRERRDERERTRGSRGQGQSGSAGGEAASQGERAEGRSSEGRSSEGRSSEGRSSEGRSSEGRSSERSAAEPRREVSVPVGDSSLAARACEVLASMKGAQPVPVRQLAQMMKKRRLVEADPEVMWRPLKSALLADSQRRAAAGLPPRVSYRGRDLFAYRPGANAELEAAEAGLESAAHRLRGATERALAARLVELPLPVLEQVVQLYLVQAGWRDIEWIKRVDRSGYAVASEPGEGGKIMVAARAGNQEVDRRGIGELRAGVAAKNLVRGHLIAPRELGSEARAELEREGRPVSALCGLRWTAALVDAGIGVAQRAMPVAYLDPELFDRLGEG